MSCYVGDSADNRLTAGGSEPLVNSRSGESTVCCSCLESIVVALIWDNICTAEQINLVVTLFLWFGQVVCSKSCTNRYVMYNCMQTDSQPLTCFRTVHIAKQSVYGWFTRIYCQIKRPHFYGTLRQ